MSVVCESCGKSVKETDNRLCFDFKVSRFEGNTKTCQTEEHLVYCEICATQLNKAALVRLRENNKSQKFPYYNIKIPCKIGDTLYWIDKGEIFESPVNEITIAQDHFIIDSMDWHYEDFGKVVFLAREEAVNKLRESDQK